MAGTEGLFTHESGTNRSVYHTNYIFHANNIPFLTVMFSKAILC